LQSLLSLVDVGFSTHFLMSRYINLEYSMSLDINEWYDSGWNSRPNK